MAIYVCNQVQYLFPSFYYKLRQIYDQSKHKFVTNKRLLIENHESCITMNDNIAIANFENKLLYLVTSGFNILNM